MHSAESDIQLWREVRSGNTESFDKLFVLYADILYNYGLKFKGDEAWVEDCIQDLFLNLWNNRKKIQIKDSPKFYFIRSFRRLLLKKTKEQKTFRDPLSSDTYSFLVELSRESIQIKEEEKIASDQKLQLALETLSPRQKEAIFLRYYENFDNEEIAQIMDIHIDSLYKLISAAVKKLRKQL